MPKGVSINWEEADAYIQERFNHDSVKKIAEDLGMNYGTVRKRTLALGLNKFKHVNWTKKQETFLKWHYPKRGGRFCADKLDIPITAVNKKANALGLYYIPKDSYVSSQGYVVVGKSGDRQLLHRKIMEEELGRPLTSNELVHHKDENKLNNNPENLILTDRAEHLVHHLHQSHKHMI